MDYKVNDIETQILYPTIPQAHTKNASRDVSTSAIKFSILNLI